jgi:hypothetical protein
MATRSGAAVKMRIANIEAAELSCGPKCRDHLATTAQCDFAPGFRSRDVRFQASR